MDAIIASDDGGGGFIADLVREGRNLERELAKAIAERDDAFTMLGLYMVGSDSQKQEIANLRARLECDAAIEDWKRKNGKA
jgi:hypothetical protein